MDAIVNFIRPILSVAQTLLDLLARMGMPPVVVGAFFAGLVISWGLTQYLKRRFTLWGRDAVGLGFLCGFFPALTIGWGHGWVTFWSAVAAGAMATGLYKAIVTVGKKRGWMWTLALSGDLD